MATKCLQNIVKQVDGGYANTATAAAAFAAKKEQKHLRDECCGSVYASFLLESDRLLKTLFL